MIILDGCCGGGGAARGYLRAGHLVWGTDLHPQPNYLASGAVGFYQADICEVLVRQLDGIEFVHVSPSCFPAGTPVIAARGVVPIEDVATGDLVLTHEGRWRHVTATMSRLGPVVADKWLAATPEHPFLARQQVHSQRGYHLPPGLTRLGSGALSDAAWVPAADLANDTFLAIPRQAEPLVIPESGQEQGPAFWYMVGRWLGDGWVRIEEASDDPRRPHGTLSSIQRPCLQCGQPAARNGRWPHLWNAFCGKTSRARYDRAHRKKSVTWILVCCAAQETDSLESKLVETGMHWRRSEERTTTRFTVANAALTRWLVANFGRYAHGKTLPGWLFGAPAWVRQAVLDGYRDADGHELAKQPGYWFLPTVSPCLAAGMRVLATTLGLSAALRVWHPKRSAVIEGRTVNERPSWTVALTPSERYGITEGRHRWVRQRRALQPRGIERVRDITVDEDHSFVAWGFVVHNCQFYSAMSACRPPRPATGSPATSSACPATSAGGRSTWPWRSTG